METVGGSELLGGGGQEKRVTVVNMIEALYMHV
jgi:hypothetical protein